MPKWRESVNDVLGESWRPSSSKNCDLWMQLEIASRELDRAWQDISLLLRWTALTCLRWLSYMASSSISITVKLVQ